jgi:nucleoside-diphosphate-sugar epimerase
VSNALIGYTGFVGATLCKQRRIESLFRSVNITDIEGQSFDTVICAGAPAQKWVANRDPDKDHQNLQTLIGHLATIQCNTFILISTVDVFGNPVGVDEHTPVDETGLHAYGLHRRMLEKFVESHFARHLIVRLAGLVGPGLRKNVVFDLLNDNNIDAIDSRAVFQFYPMVNLWPDIEIAREAGLNLVHLTAEPISVADVAWHGFGRHIDRTSGTAPAIYDMRTRYADLYGAHGHYQYDIRASILAIRAYAQSEPVTKGKHG